METLVRLKSIPEVMPGDSSSDYTYSTVIWRIENLGLWEPSFHPWEIRSPEFRLINLNECNGWTLLLFPKGEDFDGNGECFDFYFCLQSSDLTESVSFVCEWSLLDSEGSAVFKRVEFYNTTSEYTSHDIPEYPTHEDVFVTGRSSFLPNDTLTIQLRICNVKVGLGQTEHLSVVTRIWVLKESFEWLIKEFSAVQLDEEIANTVKVGAELHGFKFTLKGESLDEAIAKISMVTKNVVRTHFLKLRISLKGKDETNCMQWQHVFDSSVRDHTWVLPKFLSRRELFESRPDGSSSDDLTLFCDLTLLLLRTPFKRIERSYCGPESYLPDFLKNDVGVEQNDPAMTKSGIIVTSGSDQSYKQEECTSLAVLGEDLRSFYREKILSDFELLSEDASFHVHKMVLSARSPVFKAMFCGNETEEANPKSMDIPDLDAETLGRLVTFLYAGTIDDLEWENAAKLYYAADKYQIPSLKQKCRSVLRFNITVPNVSDILELADRHKDQELASSIHDFIQEHFDAVVLSDEWDKFLERSCLGGKTMKTVYKKILDAQIC